MSHVTDGLLHAHLDGAVGHDQAEEWLLAEAHLGVCEDCWRRLDEARQLRGAASEILELASAPAAHKPDFAVLVAQAGGSSTATRRKPWWNSTSRLAWAASLMLAVGAGWLGRELLIQTGQDVPSVIQSEPVPQTPEQTAAFSDAIEADDAAADEGQTRRGREEGDSDPVAGERAARRMAEQPADPPEVAVMQKSEVQEHAEEFRQDAASKQESVDRLEAEAEPGRERDAMARLAGSASAGPTCYAAAERVDLQRGLMDAEKVVAEDDQKKLASFALHDLRLLADGSAVASADGHELIGTWTGVSPDSVQVLLGDAETGTEMLLERTATGLTGTASQAGGNEAMADADVVAASPPIPIHLVAIECQSAP